ncbi:hypothetical protein MUP01_12020 [Candidatus Bathyarchaeota archaeon]|nr:hypothetical protein [Candidatus Bathyarchaeota archaeon]
MSTVESRLRELEIYVRSQADYKKKYEETTGELEKLRAETGGLPQTVNELQGQVTELSDKLKESEDRFGKIMERMGQETAWRLAFKKVFQPFVEEIMDEVVDGLEKTRGLSEKDMAETIDRLIVERLQKVNLQDYKMEKTLADLTLEVAHVPLLLDPKTTKGRVLYLILDGFFGKEKEKITLPQVQRELKRQFGVEIMRPELDTELMWYVEQEILSRQVRATDNAQFYKVREDARDRLHKVVRESS